MGLEAKLTTLLKKIEKNFKGEYTPEVERELAIKLMLDNELAPDKIEHSAKSYEKTSNLFRSLQLYQEALERIREKYEPHFLDASYLYGDELIHMQVKRESYCRRNKLTPEDLEQVIKDVKQRVNEEVELEQIKFWIRDDNCSVGDLEKAVELEGKYGKEQRVPQLEKMLEKGRAKSEEINRDRIIKIVHRDNAKWKITLGVMHDIKYNVNPHGETRSKNQIDWAKKLRVLKKRLEKKGIYLNERFEADRKKTRDELSETSGCFGDGITTAIIQTWDEINEEIRKEWDKKYGFEDNPPFDHDKFKAELLSRYPDPRRMNISQEKFAQITSEFYQRQLAEYKNNKEPRGLNDRLNEIQESRSRATAEQKTTREDIGQEIDR